MNTKNLLREWKTFLLNEHKVFSLQEIIQTLIQSQRSEKEVAYLKDFWINNRFITKYTQVIRDEIKYTHEPIEEILDVCELHYEKIYQSAGPDIKDQIGSGNITIDDLRKQIDFNFNFNKNEIRQQCDYQNNRPVVGNYQDFDIVYSESDFIVIEPKTTKGSIAWAHGKPDGSEETDQDRRVGWCTGVSSVNNMFQNYAGDLHMFYVINTDYDNDNSKNRRICLSFVVINGEPSLKEESFSTVNALNKSIDKEDIENIKNQKFYQNILERLQGRKETSYQNIYSKASIGQIIRIIKQMKRNNLSDNLLDEEIKNYIRYTEFDDVLLHFFQDKKYEEIITRKVSKDNVRFDNTFKKVLEIDELLPIVAKYTQDQDIIKFLISKKMFNINWELFHNENVDESIKKELSDYIVPPYETFNKETPIQDLIHFIGLFLKSQSTKSTILENIFKNVSYDNLKNIFYLLFIEKDADEIIGKSFIGNDHSLKSKKNLYCQIILYIKKINPEKFSQNFDFWLDLLINNFFTDKILENFEISYLLSDVNLNDRQVNKLIRLSMSLTAIPNNRSNVKLITCLYSLDLSDTQNKKINSIIEFENEYFSSKIFNNIYYNLDKLNNFDIYDFSLELFNSSNESQKSYLSLAVQKALGEFCPELISNYTNNSIPNYLKLLSEECLDLPYEEYSKLFHQANFDDFVKEFNSESYEFYDKYIEFIEYFRECNIVQENPEGVYNLFKSIGIDLSSERSLEYFFYGFEFDDVEECKEMFENEPYLKPIFGRNIDLNESLLKKYISLLIF